MNKAQIQQELATLPLARLNGAIDQLGGATCTLKADAVVALAHMILVNHTTLADVRNAKPMSKAPTLDLDSIASRLSSVDADIVTLHDRLRDQSNELITQKCIANAQIESLSNQLKRATQSDISTQVSEAVYEAFGAFRAVNTLTVVEQIAEALPSFRRVRAGDVFPETEYRSGDDLIDFADLEVKVWNDLEAPSIIDDYVFNPANLHQALIALDDVLPENTWLAGERGTGKTEFVSQIAGRLGRKLYRVNFDEAMERADFIGANVIENGSVVWKAGVLTQAIKHQGSIVLLDEVGFARAQSLAVLHSVCERSPHRAVVVAETGERIPVAGYVAFFASDNSNGHGDTSGNFAGVREQNSAFLDRFGFSLTFDYLPPLQEAKLIHTRSGLEHDKCTELVAFATIARQKANAGLLTQPPSLRQLFAWARAIAKGIPVRIAYQNTIVNKFPADVQAELDAIYTLQIKEGSFK